MKASLNQEPWKSGYAMLASDWHSQLTYTMQGPFAGVSRKGSYDANLGPWSEDMTAVYYLARMWYFTGNADYAQKAHDILLAWANTNTTFNGSESGLALGDVSLAYGGGAEILRGTWPGWTAADTTAVRNYFSNVLWPATGCDPNVLGPANKGAIYMRAGMSIAVFCDDTAKFNHVLDLYRTEQAGGLQNTLPTGEMGETGRDEGHAYGTLLGLTYVAEIAWKQGIDLYSELNNRLLACGEYYARNTLFFDNPFVPFGTIDATYFANSTYYYNANRQALYILQNAYKNRRNIPTPWIDRKLAQQFVDRENWMYARTADFSTAAPAAAISFPAVSLASSGLTLTTLGAQTAGRSVSYANGVWTMTGLGNDVWSDTTDDCQFAYQTMTGDCAMVARVTSCQVLNASTKAGVMIRDNLTANVSEHAWVGITNGILKESHFRGWTFGQLWGGSGRAQRSITLPPGMPYWVKVERRGNMITTFSSQDGASWATELTAYYGSLPSTVYIGLFVCSGPSSGTPTTATFDHVAFTGGTGGLMTTPAAPAAVFAVGSSKAITVRWLPSFGATSYDVLRSTTSGSGYAVVASNLSASATSYVDTTPTVGTTYYYVVQAKNSAGTSGNSPQFGDSLLPAPMVNLAFGGTASDNENSVAWNSANGFDQDPGSIWFRQGPTGWLQYDFGSGNAQVVKRYTVSSADDNIPARYPKDWQFQGSNDGTTWTTLDSQSGQSFASRMQQNAYSFGNTTAYRYYRLNITANNGDSRFLHIGDLGLWSDTGRTIPEGRYHVVNRNSNKVMDIAAPYTTNGTQIIQWVYNGFTGQKWAFAYLGNGQYQVSNLASGKVLDVGGGSTTNGAKIQLWDWLNVNSQKWTITPIGDGYFKLTAVHSGKVADVQGASTANGANVNQWSYLGGLNQQWSFTLAP
jgi:hypothetical protein